MRRSSPLIHGDRELLCEGRWAGMPLGSWTALGAIRTALGAIRAALREVEAMLWEIGTTFGRLRRWCGQTDRGDVAWRVAESRALRELRWEGHVEEVLTFWQRACGLLVTPRETTDSYSRILVFPHCRSVHTWFMAVPIDIAFVDAAGSVVELDRAVAPWGVRSCVRASLVIERMTPRTRCRPVCGGPTAAR